MWIHLAPKVIPILEEDQNAKVLLLPSKEGLEIDVAIKHGINPNQIIAIDENPALLAHAKWKNKIPKENRFGCKVSKIGEKIEAKGWYFIGANLDFCNTFSKELIEELNDFFKKSPIHKQFSFCVTMAKGRESKALFLLLKHINSPDIFKSDRLSALYEMMDLQLHYKNRLIYKDLLSLDFEKTYISSRVPMIYACFSLHPFKKGVFTKEKERYEVLHKRIGKVDKSISNNDGHNAVKLDFFKNELKKIKKGKLPQWIKNKGKDEIEEYTTKEVNDLKYKIAKLNRYKKNNVTDYCLRQKRSNLLCRIKREMKEIQRKIHNMLSLYCDNNNIIQSEKYTRSFVHNFIHSKLGDI